MQITYPHAISAIKRSPNTTHPLNHIPLQLCPSLYTTQSHTLPKLLIAHGWHKLFTVPSGTHCLSSAKFPVSSRSSPCYLHLFILNETCSSYSCEYSLPVPDAPPFLLPKHSCFLWSSAIGHPLLHVSKSIYRLYSHVSSFLESSHAWPTVNFSNSTLLIILGDFKIIGKIIAINSPQALDVLFSSDLILRITPATCSRVTP